VSFATVVLAFVVPAAGDESPWIRAALVCDPAPDLGRVRCEVEARAPAGSSIAWGDVEVLRVPALVTALRGRVGPHEASVHEPALWRWTFAVVARETGTGELGVRVRVVMCGDKGCEPREVEVAGRVQIGAPKVP
jgi:hypothetical protein